MEQKLRGFFADYEARMNKALQDPPVVDVESTASAFADFFVEASPNGVTGGKNDEQFRAKIPKGTEYYRSIGTISMNILAHEITLLDDFHSINKIRWQALFRRREGGEEAIDFDVIYLVQILKDEPKIFAYVTGDEQKILKEHGLIPA